MIGERYAVRTHNITDTWWWLSKFIYNHHTTIVRMDDLTAFQRDILYIVGGADEPHGLAIKSDLEAYYETEVNHGQLYPNLDELVDAGLINKGEYDKRTNIYTLTSDGREVLKTRREWENGHLDTM